MKKYWFKKVAEDGSEWFFQKKFPDAFKADRWAMSKFHAWFTGKVNFRIVFLA